jgi:predicted membrane protein
MDQDQKNLPEYRQTGRPRIWSGIVLLAAGFLLLAYKMGAPVPGWVFTWPVLLIAIGMLTGIRSRFHNPGSLIMIMIGGIFLIDQINPELNFQDYILPAILIGIGIVYILRPGQGYVSYRKRKWQRSFYDLPEAPSTKKFHNENGPVATEGNAEFVEINAVFGGVKKIILSKNFRGGEINCFMGGAEINLMQADIQKPITLEVNNVFGGTKLIVPSNWNVKNEVTAVFGAIEDKRNVSGFPDPSKTLVLDGTCIFGGISIINY